MLCFSSMIQLLEQVFNKWQILHYFTNYSIWTNGKYGKGCDTENNWSINSLIDPYLQKHKNHASVHVCAHTCTRTYNKIKDKQEEQGKAMRVSKPTQNQIFLLFHKIESYLFIWQENDFMKINIKNELELEHIDGYRNQ